MKIKFRVATFLFLILLGGCQKRIYYEGLIRPDVVNVSRIVNVKVRCLTFSGSRKTVNLRVLDVTVDNVKMIFWELYKNRFPIYNAFGYENRVAVGGIGKVSLHAYGGAIDVNDYINPYYNVLSGQGSIIPARFRDRERDHLEIRNYLIKIGVVNEKELDKTIAMIIQPAGSDDWFINREIARPGMLTQKEAKIFNKHGFTVWGGNWRQPIDFMHFQIPRTLAERLAKVGQKEGRRIWANHLLLTKWQNLLKAKLGSIKKAKREAIWQDHLLKCQQDKEQYLAAANHKHTTIRCIRDCQHKINDLNPNIS